MSLNLDKRTEDFPSIFRLIFFNVILNKVTPIPSEYTQHLASTWLRVLEKGLCYIACIYMIFKRNYKVKPRICRMEFGIYQNQYNTCFLETTKTKLQYSKIG